MRSRASRKCASSRMRFGKSVTNTHNMSQALQPAGQTAAVGKRPPTKLDVVRAHLESPAFLQQVQMAMPTGEDGKRLIRGAITAMQKNPKIGECLQTTIFTSLLTCAQLRLNLDGREAHLVPFWDGKAGPEGKGAMVCTLIPDYKGLVRLVLQSGNISNVHADLVCQNDTFEFDKGRILAHRINFRVPRGDVYAVYALATFKDGTEKAEVMSVDEVEKVRQGSKQKDGKPWQDHWGEQAKKTVFKRLTKWLPLSPEANEAIHIDNTRPAEASLPVEETDDDGPVELPKRESRAPRTTVTADAPPPPAPTPPAETPPQQQQPPPPPAAGQRATLPRRGRATNQQSPPPPPPPPTVDAQSTPVDESHRGRFMAWIGEHSITPEEIATSLSTYFGEDTAPVPHDRLSDDQVEFLLSNSEALTDLIKGSRV